MDENDRRIKALEAMVEILRKGKRLEPHVDPAPGADYEDSWMHPQTSVSYVSKPLENKTKYTIERQERQICFGHPGSIKRWKVYREFDTLEEREKEYKYLKAQHPVWCLRYGQCNPYLDRLRATYG